jgi:ParB family chromosome partitioning protein
LIDQYGLTQERLSERVGKKRATVANYLRLLKLPAPVQMALQNRQIDTGHARALLALEDPKEQVRLFREVQQKGYSVRQVEDAIKKMKAGEKEVAPQRKAPSLSEEMDGLRVQFAERLGVAVKLTCGKDGDGKLTLAFKSADELRQLLDKIK